MPLLQTSLPELTGVYNSKLVKLVKKPLKGSKLVRGKEYPIGLDLVVESQDGTLSGLDIAEVNQFFQDLGESGTLLQLITEHGLVIIQNLNSTDPEHYSQIVNSFFKAQQYHEFEQVGLLAVREKVKKAVSTVGNDDKLNKNLGKLSAHQEFSRYLDYPHVLTFFAEKAPKLGGGQSTTTHATELFDRVVNKFPEFIRDLYEKQGNHVSQKFSYKVSGESKFKISWTDEGAFGKYITQEEKDSEDIEAMKAKAVRLANERVSKNVEFDEHHDLILHQTSDIVQIHPLTKNPIIFSSLPTYYGGYYKAKKGKTEDEISQLTPPPLSYGDGDLIPEKYLDYLFEQSQELEYTHDFADGDILFLDNFSVYHGRNPYTRGDRTILASFWEQKDSSRPKPYKPQTLEELIKPSI
ncbi:unnamed protein product [Kuraishia capsulata CBS 1993]|uniref:TauD/TfdA-like domain-containing protein n=1 Tax=Kuraishia capsulata CBS 1993 TaxID=1382522 RepID=W6MWR5_9ASCO|nr:uncharacterized protein KUCA_T00003764001 [Kuraishia capsulata CBS 1993]CDK27785.1 unnamed protein product [Kuraishia capsulata CBS 1993]